MYYTTPPPPISHFVRPNTVPSHHVAKTTSFCPSFPNNSNLVTSNGAANVIRPRSLFSEHFVRFTVNGSIVTRPSLRCPSEDELIDYAIPTIPFIAPFNDDQVKKRSVVMYGLPSAPPHLSSVLKRKWYFWIFYRLLDYTGLEGHVTSCFPMGREYFNVNLKYSTRTVKIILDNSHDSSYFIKRFAQLTQLHDFRFALLHLSARASMGDAERAKWRADRKKAPHTNRPASVMHMSVHSNVPSRSHSPSSQMSISPVRSHVSHSSHVPPHVEGAVVQENQTCATPSSQPPSKIHCGTTGSPEQQHPASHKRSRAVSRPSRRRNKSAAAATPNRRVVTPLIVNLREKIAKAGSKRTATGAAADSETG